MTASGTRRAARLPRVISWLGATLLSACAGTSPEVRSDVPYDPLESFNRRVYAFNTAADHAVLRPVASGYRHAVPAPVRRGVSNFLDNLTTPRSAVNNFLQGKPGRGLSEFGRFLFNTTIGLGGFIDIAALGGMQEYDEDFGQTLAVWGLPEGPYLVLPLLGARSLLETVAYPVDFQSRLERRVEDPDSRVALTVISVIDLRQRLLAADEFLDESNDPYIAFREAYRQNRAYKIYDGDPPVMEDYYEFLDEEDY